MGVSSSACEQNRTEQIWGRRALGDEGKVKTTK